MTGITITLIICLTVLACVAIVALSISDGDESNIENLYGNYTKLKKAKSDNEVLIQKEITKSNLLEVANTSVKIGDLHLTDLEKLHNLINN